jgi:hypothetical protein
MDIAYRLKTAIFWEITTFWSVFRRLRWSSGSHAGLWFPSSRVQTRPKPLDFFRVKNPQHALLRSGS